ncbi:MAG: hypothetical protein LBV60_19505 [Streptomyces sp.]|nr:hypothetical protein [Streptomyces sp.]
MRLNDLPFPLVPPRLSPSQPGSRRGWCASWRTNLVRTTWAEDDRTALGALAAAYMVSRSTEPPMPIA